MLDRTTLSRTLALSLLFLVLTLSASAQTITVRNGGALRMSNGGVWHLGGTTVDLGGPGSSAQVAETGGSRFTGGELTATRALNSPSSVDVAGLGAAISASVDLGKVTVTRGHVRHTLPGHNASIKRFYDLSPSKNNRGLSATLTFHYADAELGDLSESALELFKSNGRSTTWRPRGADSRDPVANTVTLRRIRSLSRWTLGASKRAAAGPPVDSPEGGSAAGRLKLASLEAGVNEDGDVNLIWRPTSRTQDAKNQNAGFEVQRKHPGAALWTEIGFVEEASTTGESQTYRFTDEDLPYGVERFTYRLRKVDLDGSVAYSEAVEAPLAVPDRLVLRENFPNPFTEQTTIRYELPESAEVHLSVYNALGQRVTTLVRGKQQAGRHEITFEAHALPSGVYFVRLTSEGTTRTRKLTVVR